MVPIYRTWFSLPWWLWDVGDWLSFSRFSPLELKKNWDWEKLAIALFEHIYQTGGLFHLWGHSWEIDRLAGWRKLENVLAYIAQKSDVTHVTNTEALLARNLVALPLVAFLWLDDKDSTDARNRDSCSAHSVELTLSWGRQKVVGPLTVDEQKGRVALDSTA